MSSEIEAFLEYISVIRTLSPRSVEAYRSDLVLLENEAKKPLIELDSSQIFTLLANYKNRRTLNRKLSSINAFFDFCHSRDFATDKQKLKLSKVPKLLPKFLEYERFISMLEMIDRSSVAGLRDYALLLFLYASGARISEALDLMRSDIEDGWLKIRSAKGQKERVVPIARVAINAIDEYLSLRDKKSEFVWLNYKGDKLSRVSAFKVSQKYLLTSPHVLRHSYATALIRGGADLRVVQELLGHSSLLTTQVYTHIQKHDLASTLEACHPMARSNIAKGDSYAKK